MNLIINKLLKYHYQMDELYLKRNLFWAIKKVNDNSFYIREGIVTSDKMRYTSFFLNYNNVENLINQKIEEGYFCIGIKI